MDVFFSKIEQAFYDSKIRVNGRKITKKSASVSKMHVPNFPLDHTCNKIY